MNRQDFTVAQLMDILVQRTGLPHAARTEDSSKTFADIGLDSLAFLQVQGELATRYGFDLPQARTGPYTFGDIVGHVNAELARVAA